MGVTAVLLGPPFTPLKVTILCALALLMAASTVWQFWARWREHKRRATLSPERGLRPLGRPSDPRKTLSTAFVILLIALGVGTALLERFGSLRTRIWIRFIHERFASFGFYFIIVMVGLLGVLLILHWLGRDKALIATARLALAGKHREAEETVRNAIASKGPTEKRLTVLGVLLMEQNRHEESIQQFEAAQALAKNPAASMNNRANALIKLNRRDEALALLQDACTHAPQDFIIVTNCCLLLAELGRETEAFDRLEQAERIYERYDAKYVKQWTPILEKCRNTLPTARGFPVISPSSD